MTRGLCRPGPIPESWGGHRTRLQDSAGDVRVSGRVPVPDMTTRLLRGNSLTRSFKEEVALDHQLVLHPDEEERRTLDLEVIQADCERETRAQPASAVGEPDGDLDRDALPVELHRAGQDDRPRGVEGELHSSRSAFDRAIRVLHLVSHFAHVLVAIR